MNNNLKKAKKTFMNIANVLCECVLWKASYVICHLFALFGTSEGSQKNLLDILCIFVKCEMHL